MIIVKMLALFLGAALYIPGIVLAAEKDPVSRLGNQLESEQAVAFVADCQDGDVKMFVVFRAGDAAGFYGQIQQHPFITLNMGEIAIASGDWRVTATAGGLVSGPAQRETIAYLMKQPFHILPADQLVRIYRETLPHRCDFN